MMRRIVELKWSYHQSNPDVGFGPSPDMVVEDEAKFLGIKLSEAEKQALVKEVESYGNY